MLMPRSPWLLIAQCTLFLAACGVAQPSATATPQPSATPEGPQTLSICLGNEPASLYLYADNSSSAQAVRQAIYDGPFDWVGYQPQGVLFDGAPQVRTQSVTVRQGDLVVDAEGRLVTLAAGVVLRSGDCREGDCLLTYSEGEVQVSQLAVTFTLREGLGWSDGAPLTATDSVYAFEVAAAAETPTDKEIIRRTASYSASDARTVTWVGVPGYLDAQAATRFWSPLPQHAWGSLPVAALAGEEQVARRPLGWGPYVIDQWIAGEQIQLRRNPNYAGPAPHFAELRFVFIGHNANTAAALADGRCDLLLPSSGASEVADGQNFPIEQDQWLHLVFGITPQAYDDGYNVYADRADFFSAPAMRTAFAQCIDREAIAAGLGGRLANSYLPDSSPYATAAAALPAFDPAAGAASLEAQGWRLGADGWRSAQGFAGALFGQALEMNLAVAESDLATAERVQANLAECGVKVNLQALPTEELFATGPQSPVFGRNFDLALFAWPFGEQPACYLFLGDAVPGTDWSTHAYGWGGWNVSGWQDEAFDSACRSALSHLAGTPDYAAAQQAAQAIFAEQLPALPLAVPLGYVVARADFCGLEPDVQAGSRLLQNLESYGYGSWCQ